VDAEEYDLSESDAEEVIHLDSNSRVPPLNSYRGTSLMKNSAPVGPHNGTMPRALRWF